MPLAFWYRAKPPGVLSCPVTRHLKRVWFSRAFRSQHRFRRLSRCSWLFPRSRCVALIFCFVSSLHRRGFVRSVSLCFAFAFSERPCPSFFALTTSLCSGVQTRRPTPSPPSVLLRRQPSPKSFRPNTAII